MTTKRIQSRYSHYEKGVKVFCNFLVPHARIAESNILNFFKLKYKQRIDYGYEYFEGNLVDMYTDFRSIANKCANKFYDKEYLKELDKNYYHPNVMKSDNININNKNNIIIWINKNLEESNEKANDDSLQFKEIYWKINKDMTHICRKEFLEELLKSFDNIKIIKRMKTSEVYPNCKKKSNKKEKRSVLIGLKWKITEKNLIENDS